MASQVLAQAAAQDEWLGGCLIYPSEVEAAAQGATSDDVASAYGKEAVAVLQEAAALQDEAADEEEADAEHRPAPAGGAPGMDIAPSAPSMQQRLRLLRVKIALATALRRIGRDAAAKHQLEEAVFRLRILNDQDALKGGALGGLEAFDGAASSAPNMPAEPFRRLLLEMEVDKEALLADALVQVRVWPAWIYRVEAHPGTSIPPSLEMQLALCSCVQQGSATIVAVKEVIVASSGAPAHRPRSIASSSSSARTGQAAVARLGDGLGSATDDGPGAEESAPSGGKGKPVFRTGLKAQSEAARRKQAERALSMLAEARAVYMAADGALSLRAADVDIAMGDLLRCTGSADDSRKRYDAALQTLRTRGDGTEHIRTGTLLTGLAAIVTANATAAQKQDARERDDDTAYAAVRLMSEALAAYTAILPDDHPAVMTARARMAEQLDACGMTEDALAVYEQVGTLGAPLESPWESLRAPR